MSEDRKLKENLTDIEFLVREPTFSDLDIFGLFVGPVHTLRIRSLDCFIEGLAWSVNRPRYPRGELRKRVCCVLLHGVLNFLKNGINLCIQVMLMVKCKFRARWDDGGGRTEYSTVDIWLE